MILITGSSMAIGEWDNGQNSHGGLGYYLRESGRNVLNIAQPGKSDFVYIKVLENFLDYNPSINVDKIILFQSSWIDNFNSEITLVELDHGDYEKALSSGYNQFISFCVSSMYYRLSRLGVKHNIPIYVVGGFTDTIWLDRFTKEYPMVTIACQSFVNLLINQNHRIDKPVRTFLTNPATATNIIEKIKKELPLRDIELLIDDLSLSEERLKSISKCKEFFWPDGWHINRHGHKILFDFLTKNYQI
jgi:hypothetical protein